MKLNIGGGGSRRPRKRKKKQLKQKLKEAPEPQYYILLRFGAFRPLRDRDLRRDAVIIRPVFLFYRDEDRLGYPLVVCLLLCDFFWYFFVVLPFRVKLGFLCLVL